MAITFDLPPELHDQIRQVAAAERRSVTQTLIVAAEEYVRRRRREAQVDAVSSRIAAEDAELLRRLA